VLVTYNQAGANDETFRAALEKYHREKLTNNEKISRRLLADYDIQMRYASFAIFHNDCDKADLINQCIDSKETATTNEPERQWCDYGDN
jgi:hypothetical protein